MKKPTLYLIACLSFVLAFASVWIFFYKPPPPESASHGPDALMQESSATSASAAEPLYYCPMHAQVQSHEQGNCPICGMDLVARASTETDAPQKETMETEALVETPTTPEAPHRREKAMGMVMGRITKRALAPRFTAFAHVAFDRELYQAQSEYLETRRQFLARSPARERGLTWRSMLEAARMRLQAHGLSKEHIAFLDQRGAAEAALLTSQGKEPLIIYARVWEDDLAHITRGQQVRIQARSHHPPSPALMGEVMFVDQRVRSGGAITVRIKLLDARHNLRSGSLVTAEFITRPQEHVTVPYDSVLWREGGGFILLEDETEGGLSMTKIDVLFISGDWVATSNAAFLGRQLVRHHPFVWEADRRLNATLQGGDTAKPSTTPDHSYH